MAPPARDDFAVFVLGAALGFGAGFTAGAAFAIGSSLAAGAGEAAEPDFAVEPDFAAEAAFAAGACFSAAGFGLGAVLDFETGPFGVRARPEATALGLADDLAFVPETDARDFADAAREGLDAFADFFKESSDVSDAGRSAGGGARITLFRHYRTFGLGNSTLASEGADPSSFSGSCQTARRSPWRGRRNSSTRRWPPIC